MSLRTTVLLSVVLFAVLSVFLLIQHEMQVGHVTMGSIKHMLLEQGSAGKGKPKNLRTNRGDTPLAFSDLLQRQFYPPNVPEEINVDDKVEEDDPKQQEEEESEESSGSKSSTSSTSSSKGNVEIVDGMEIPLDDDDDVEGEEFSKDLENAEHIVSA